MMLKRTLQLIGDLPPGSYIPDDDKRYDEAEIAELGSVLNRLLYAPSQIRAKLQEHGVSIVPANFYGETPLISEIEDTRSQAPTFAAIFDPEVMDTWLARLDRYADEFAPPEEPDGPGAFGWVNGQFGYSDAMAYYCMIREAKPARVLEIGSGWSSLVALAALRENGRGELICVDPYPSPVLDAVRDQLELVTVKAQELNSDFVSTRLGDGDIFFIDSTHTVRHDSDCLHIYLRLLPGIQADVYVHAHDIRLPRPLSIEMMRDSQIYWTEQYLLYAYLLGNSRCQVLFGSAYLVEERREALTQFMRGRASPGGGSLWFKQASMKP